MFALAKWNSSLYQEALNLRNIILKASAGKSFLTESPINEKGDIHLVVKQDSKVVGTLLLHPCTVSCIQIKQVAFFQEYQGQGLGRKLISYAEYIARDSDYSTIFLKGREQAWGFYQKLGYKELMESYTEDDLILKIFKKNIQELTCFQNKLRIK